MLSGIYSINHASGRSYIGSARNLRSRWNLHRAALRRGDHHNRKLQHAWSKYGESQFAFCVLEYVEVSGLIQREQHWIDSQKPWYNICAKAGSRLGTPHSEEARLRMSAAQKRRAPPSAETRAKISAAGKGRVITEVHRRRLSEARAGRIFTATHREKLSAWQRGRKMSPETRAKMSSAHLGKRKGPFSEAHRASIRAARLAYLERTRGVA